MIISSSRHNNLDKDVTSLLVFNPSGLAQLLLTVRGSYAVFLWAGADTNVAVSNLELAE